MKRVYECVRCGARYPLEHVHDWGKHEASSGYGARPCCTALVLDHLGSGAVCRGDIVVTDVSDADAAKVPPVRPIK